MHARSHRAALAAVMMFTGAAACERAETPPARSVFSGRAPAPEEMPTLVSTELPFRYPAQLYMRRVQGNVTLRLFVDGDGKVVADSTRIAEPSGYAALDSAALSGAGELHFAPAKRHGAAMPVTILFPVYFRHPEARPLPGDTILNAVSKAGV